MIEKLSYSYRTSKRAKENAKSPAYFAFFGILLFFGLTITLPSIGSFLNQIITKAHAAATCSLQTEWIPKSTSFQPLTDTEAIARICPNLETKPSNTTANAYLPSASEISAFLSAKNQYGQTPAQANPYTAYVTGGCAASGRSTDDLIQCGAAKWGIPYDWMRAQFMLESTWLQSAMGDKAYVGTTNALLYPEQSQEKESSGNLTGCVFESLGISQIKWRPDGSRNPGTEPLRWKSTAFNIDYYGASIRFHYDDPQGLRSAWGDSTYVSGEDWWSVGANYQPYPWHNSDQNDYIRKVQEYLARLRQ